MTRVFGLHRPGDDRRTEDPAAAPDGHEQDVQIRRGLEQLQGAGRHAGDQQRLVGRVDVAQAVVPGPGLGGRRASSKSRPARTTSAPRARVAATFSGLAASGM